LPTSCPARGGTAPRKRPVLTPVAGVAALAALTVMPVGWMRPLPPASAAPPDRTVETALKDYCAREKIDRAKLEPCQLDLIPGTAVYRYTLPPIKVEPDVWRSLPERYAVVFVDTRTGRLLDLKMLDPDADHRAFYRPLFAEMRRAGRKVTTNKEAEAALRNLMLLEGWLRSGKPSRDPAGITVDGPYRGRRNTFGGGVYLWFSGDDVGLEVDAEGYPVGLLGGHIR
jgi:hypothetical protein